MNAIQIVIPESGVAFTVNSLAEGDWTAMLGYLDKVPTGFLKNVVIKKAGQVIGNCDGACFAVAKAYRVGKAFDRRGNSKKLGENLRQMLGLARKPAGGAAHHMIPPGGNIAAKLRLMLEKLGLKEHPDGAWNGVFLPGVQKGDAKAWAGDAYGRLHPDALPHGRITYGAAATDYEERLVNRLMNVIPVDQITNVNKDYWLAQFLDEMREVRTGLLNGNLP